MKKFLISTVTFLLPFALVHAQPVPSGIEYTLQSFIWPGSIEQLLVAILEVFIIVATPIVILFIIYAGFLYVTAAGNASQVEKATRALTYSIIGGLLVIGALAIAQIVSNLVGAIASGA